ncbi:MAG: inositol monophosphatase family protein [Patescibacteria group bacterium]|jgi:myo-inositol-1(or 4)-monophosphatase|nr:inositol monophosphatase family protein [Patescibacteria group bacterium]
MDNQFAPIIDAARQGGEQLKKYFGRHLDIINEKLGPADLQTTADLESERAVLAILNKHYPDYNIFSEEVGMIDRGSDFTFYIDPLDGTNNFVLGIPYFSCSIALVQGHNVIFAAVYSPITDNLYYAQRGQGAFLNSQPIKVNVETAIDRCTVGYNTGYDVSDEENLKITRPILALDIKRLLINWSPALDLCLLASGRIEAIVVNRGEWHDFLAGHLIAQEAGAIITDFFGQVREHDQVKSFVVANSSAVSQKIVSIAKDF